VSLDELLESMAERERFELSRPRGLGTLAVCWAPYSPFPLHHTQADHGPVSLTDPSIPSVVKEPALVELGNQLVPPVATSLA
jgi:hypothetical protein